MGDTTRPLRETTPQMCAWCTSEATLEVAVPTGRQRYAPGCDRHVTLHTAREGRFDHGGKDSRQVRWVQDEPTPTDKLKLMQASRAALDGSLRIAAAEQATGDEPVKALLVELGKSLGILPADSEQGQEAD